MLTCCQYSRPEGWVQGGIPKKNLTLDLAGLVFRSWKGLDGAQELSCGDYAGLIRPEPEDTFVQWLEKNDQRIQIYEVEE